MTKPLTDLKTLKLKASKYFKLPNAWILDVIPNASKTKYFVHCLLLRIDGKASYETKLIDAQELEKIIPDPSCY